MTNHRDILNQAVTILDHRGRRYGSMEESFERASMIASTILGKQITIFDLAIIMTAIKLSRITSTQTLDDNYIDGINYLAFAGQFSTAEEQISVALEEDIAAMARKYAPRRPDVATEEQETIEPTA